MTTLIASLNPVFQAAAENTSLGWLLGATTVFFIASFAGWVWWVFRPANAATMEAASRMPLEDDDPRGSAGGVW